MTEKHVHNNISLNFQKRGCLEGSRRRIEGEQGRKRRAGAAQLKDMSSLYFLSLVQISALESVSGNQSADKIV